MSEKPRIDRDAMLALVGGEFHYAYGFNWNQIEYFEQEDDGAWHPHRPDGVAFFPSPSIFILITGVESTMAGVQIATFKADYDLTFLHPKLRALDALVNAARPIVKSLEEVGRDTNWQLEQETDRVYAWFEIEPLKKALEMMQDNPDFISFKVSEHESPRP